MKAARPRISLPETFPRGLQANSLREAFRRVEIYIAADLRRNPRQTLDTHIYFKFPGAASAL